MEPSALAVWQTLPQPLFTMVGVVAPGWIFMIPTDARPPRISEP